MFETSEPATGRMQPEPALSANLSVQTAKKDSHPGKKPVLIHIPEAMHKDLRRIALEEDTPLTQITERLLRRFLVAKGYTQHASADTHPQNDS
jgi:hypothetical protein